MTGVARMFGMALAIASTACFVFEESIPADDLVKLVGRCIRLKQTTFVLDSGDDDSPLYLSTSQSSIDRTVMTLEPGTRFHVENVVLRTKVENTMIVVYAKTNGVADRIAVSRLFAASWLMHSSLAVTHRDSNAEVLQAPMLDDDVAIWCDPP